MICCFLPGQPSWLRDHREMRSRWANGPRSLLSWCRNRSGSRRAVMTRPQPIAAFDVDAVIRRPASCWSRQRSSAGLFAHWRVRSAAGRHRCLCRIRSKDHAQALPRGTRSRHARSDGGEGGAAPGDARIGSARRVARPRTVQTKSDVSHRHFTDQTLVPDNLTLDTFCTEIRCDRKEVVQRSACRNGLNPLGSYLFHPLMREKLGGCESADHPNLPAQPRAKVALVVPVHPA